MNQNENIKVWDLVVRVFHWSLVIVYSIAYISGDNFINIHIWSSYTILALIFIRLCWGIIGSPYARFSQFVQPPIIIIHYLKDLIRKRAKRYIGHNPAGGAMIIALLVLILLTGLSGLLLYGLDNQAGPLAFMYQANNETLEELFEEIHEILANITVLLILVHLAGVVLVSQRHNENIVRAMITGYKSNK